MNKLLNELNIINNIIVEDYEYLLKLEFPEAAMKEEFEISKKLQSLIDSIGENACRMLEIGIVQDKLVELGFEKSQSEIDRMNYFINDGKLPFNLKFIIYFETSRIIIAPPLQSAVYLNEYTPTWQQDILAKVKELINV